MTFAELLKLARVGAEWERSVACGVPLPEAQAYAQQMQREFDEVEGILNTLDPVTGALSIDALLVHLRQEALQP